VASGIGVEVLALPLGVYAGLFQHVYHGLALLLHGILGFLEHGNASIRLCGLCLKDTVEQ